MWRKYRDKRTEAIANGGHVKSLSGIALQAERRLNALNAATSLEDLRSSRGNRLEALKGDRTGQYSIRINDQYRICFQWPDDQLRAVEIEIVDYH